MGELFRKRTSRPIGRSADRKDRSLRIPAAALSALLAGSLVFSGCALLPVEEEPLQPPLVEPAQEPVDIVNVARGDIETFLKGTANFVSSEVKALSFTESGGRIKSISVKLGDEVQAGDLLAELETGDLALQADLQRLNVERAQLLYRKALADGADATDLRLREIDLERERKSLLAMEGRLDKARLHAPIAGIVTFVQSLNTGDAVGAFQPIVTVANPRSVQLVYVASESQELRALEVGMPATLKIGRAHV